MLRPRQSILFVRVLPYGKVIKDSQGYAIKITEQKDASAEEKKIPEVLECHYTTGNWSIFCKILCKDNEHLMHVLNRDIQSITGVSRTETFISLDQQINRQIKI